MLGSNQRPAACKTAALPAELIDQYRHDELNLDFQLRRPASYPLDDSGLIGRANMKAPVGLEPTLSDFADRRLNPLGYGAEEQGTQKSNPADSRVWSPTRLPRAFPPSYAHWTSTQRPMPVRRIELRLTDRKSAVLPLDNTGNKACRQKTRGLHHLHMEAPLQNVDERRYPAMKSLITFGVAVSKPTTSI